MIIFLYLVPILSCVVCTQEVWRILCCEEQRRVYSVLSSFSVLLYLFHAKEWTLAFLQLKAELRMRRSNLVFLLFWIRSDRNFGCVYVCLSVTEMLFIYHAFHHLRIFFLSTYSEGRMGDTVNHSSKVQIANFSVLFSLVCIFLPPLILC